MLNDEQMEVLPIRAKIQGELAGFVMNGAVAGEKYIAREVLYLTTELATALLDLKEAQGVLKEVEWIGIQGGPEGETWYIGCPVCLMREQDGHDPAGCKLAKNLEKE